MVKMIDVAHRAGVSVATVSRVINKPELVDIEKRKAVMAVIHETGFRPNALARGLVNKSSKTIGVVINQFSSSYYGRMLDGVEQILSKVNFKTIAESSRETAEGELEAVASLSDRQCEGIILHSDLLSLEVVQGLLREHPSLIMMNRPVDDFEDRCVYIDNIHIGRIAARYLSDARHRDIAVVTGPMILFECRHRLRGFQGELMAQGRELDPNMIVESDFTVEGGYVAMEQIIASKRPVSAVFFMNDEMAAGAIDMCLSNGISVPDQISILGCDDLDWAAYIHPKLSTIRQPLEGLGQAAGALAHAFAAKEDGSNHQRVLQAEVIERASVRQIES